MLKGVNAVHWHVGLRCCEIADGGEVVKQEHCVLKLA